MRFQQFRVSGGVASLNHRLIAVNPPGWTANAQLQNSRFGLVLKSPLIHYGLQNDDVIFFELFYGTLRPLFHDDIIKFNLLLPISFIVMFFPALRP